jgi:hypothetical protein
VRWETLVKWSASTGQRPEEAGVGEVLGAHNAEGARCRAGGRRYVAAGSLVGEGQQVSTVLIGAASRQEVDWS